MIEEIRRIGAKHVGIENPAAPRYVHAELFLFVALTVERDESQIVAVRQLQQRARSGDERRRLIVVAIGSAEGPIKVRHIERNAEARANRALDDVAGKVSGTKASGERQPGERFEFVIEEERCHAAGEILGVREGRVAAAVMENRFQHLIVLLVEAVDTHLQIVLRFIGAETYLAAAVGGSAMLGGDDRIGRSTVIIGAVVVIERRDR